MHIMLGVLTPVRHGDEALMLRLLIIKFIKLIEK